MKNKSKITPNTLKKYKKVVDEWFNNDFNGKQAYLKFYKNVKDDTASTNFSKISVIPEIKEYIREKHEEASKFVKMTREGILKELTNWVQSDITETIDLTPEQVKELPIGIKRLITKYKQTNKSHYDQKGNLLEKTKVIELHFVSKERAIEMINKHIGFYEIDNRQKAAQISLESLTTEELIARAKIVKGLTKNE
jgi:phage terminase small subunit